MVWAQGGRAAGQASGWLVAFPGVQLLGSLWIVAQLSQNYNHAALKGRHGMPPPRAARLASGCNQDMQHHQASRNRCARNMHANTMVMPMHSVFDVSSANACSCMHTLQCIHALRLRQQAAGAMRDVSRLVCGECARIWHMHACSCGTQSVLLGVAVSQPCCKGRSHPWQVAVSPFITQAQPFQ